MDKVRCPWCNGEMEPDPHSAYKDMRQLEYWYWCEECGSQSPRISETDYETGDAARVAAYAAAMRRWQEPLKPLKLHEVTGSEEPCVFLEIRGNERIWACDCVISSNFKGVHISFIGDPGRTLVAIYDYCKTWRCWSRRPTDEERAGAGWVDEAGE